jgi:hypothetical protein
MIDFDTVYSCSELGISGRALHHDYKVYMMVPKDGTEITTEKPTADDITGSAKWDIAWFTKDVNGDAYLMEPIYAWKDYAGAVPSWQEQPFNWVIVTIIKKFGSPHGGDSKEIRLSPNGTLVFKELDVEKLDVEKYGWAPQNWLADDPKGTVVKLDTLE